ncbi:unnamed protein product, partial [Prorocentrum cordatum]
AGAARGSAEEGGPDGPRFSRRGASRPRCRGGGAAGGARARGPVRRRAARPCQRRPVLRRQRPAGRRRRWPPGPPRGGDRAVGLR